MRRRTSAWLAMAVLIILAGCAPSSPSSAASTAPLSEVSSQGCATAAGVGAKSLQRSSRRSYFACFFSMLNYLCVRPESASPLSKQKTPKRSCPLTKNARNPRSDSHTRSITIFNNIGWAVSC